MKFLVLTLCVLLLAPAMAQVPEGYDFVGNYSDFKKLPRYTGQVREFTFVRLMYNGQIPTFIKNWYTDWPYGDANLTEVLKRITGLDITLQSRVVPIVNTDLFRYPFIYSGEAGHMVLDKNDARILREYIDRGGFWMIDDFWGDAEWADFEGEMKKIFPDREIREITLDSPILHSFYNIPQIMQIPNTGYALSCPNDDSSCTTSEDDGIVPHMRGIFNDRGRLQVFINWNTDLMDGSEGADLENYPERFSAYSFRVFANAIVYAMTH